MVLDLLAQTPIRLTAHQIGTTTGLQTAHARDICQRLHLLGVVDGREETIPGRFCDTRSFTYALTELGQEVATRRWLPNVEQQGI